MFLFIFLTKEERILRRAIIDARKIQEFLWHDLSLSNGADMDQWVNVFQKRVDKIKQINPARYGASVELRKRILQQASLSILALRTLNEGKIKL